MVPLIRYAMNACMNNSVKSYLSIGLVCLFMALSGVMRPSSLVKNNVALLMLLKSGAKSISDAQNLEFVNNPRITWLLGLQTLDGETDRSDVNALGYWRRFPIWNATMLRAAADNAGRQGRLEDAIFYAELSLILSPSGNPVSKIVAKHLTEQGYWKQATRFWQIAEQEEPNDAEVQTWLGYVFSKQKKIEQARSHLERAIVLAPQAWDSNNNYVRFLREYGPRTDYKTQLSRCLVLFPETMIYAFWFGEMALEEQNYEVAERYFMQVLENRPSWVNVVQRLQELYMQTGQPARSVELYRKAIELNPNNVAIHKGYIKSLLAINDAASARAHLCYVKMRDESMFAILTSDLEISVGDCSSNE
jgi:tetratricopeptide (TPR) repeat protein